MKQGRSITELAQELELQARAKKDFISPTSQLRMVDGNRLVIGTQGEFDINDHAHTQIAERLDIPKKYYDRMKAEAPQLLQGNANHWFQAKPEKRMLRTMTVDRPVLRAFLSDRYRRLDNLELMQAVIPFMLKEYGQPLQIASCDVTETRLYLKVIAPHTERDLTTFLKPGTHQFIHEPVRAGFIVQNSEIGMGAISAYPYVDMLRCSNGMIVTEYGQRKYHAGKRLASGGSDEDASELESMYSDDTRRLDDAAFWSKTKDIIRACLSDGSVTKIYTKMAEARDMKIEGKPEEVVELLATNYALNEAEKAGVLRTLIDSGVGFTQYGLVNAVNQVANTVNSYDRASELEAAAGKILTLAPSEWKVLSSAA